MQKMVRNLEDGICITNDKLEVVVVNQRLLDIFGIEVGADALEGESKLRLAELGTCCPEDRDAFNNRLIELSKQPRSRAARAAHIPPMGWCSIGRASRSRSTTPSSDIYGRTTT